MRHERNRARDQINSRLPEYLEKEKGLSLKKPFHCLNPDHPDKNPSMSYDQARNKVHCFGCGQTYDRLDLIGIDYNLADYNEILKKGCEIYGIRLDERAQEMDKKEAHHGRGDRLQGNKANTEKSNLVATENSTEGEQIIDLTAQFQEWHNQLDQTDYLQRRGISPEVAARFKVGFCPDWKNPKAPNDPAIPRLIIPTSKGTYTARATDDPDPKRRYRNFGDSLLMNLEALKGDRPVYIVEGEIDALSIAEAGGVAVGLGSVSNYGKLPAIAEKAKPKRPLILALDNDKAGQEATEDLARGLYEAGVPYRRYNPYGDHKDANAALLADLEAFKLAIKEGEALEEKEYRATKSAAAYMGELEARITASMKREELSTGWPGLDAQLDGGLNPELIALGAITGLGKTTLILQMADQIAMQGKDVLYFSLEMGRHELMARSISRLTSLIGRINTFPADDWKTSRGIIKGKRYEKYDEQEHELIGWAKDRYTGYAKHLFIHEGLRDTAVEDIIAAVDEHERITGKPPAAVFLDYLQILKPPKKLDIKNPTTKDIIDDAIWALKELSRSKEIPIIAVSSLNRDNYKDKTPKKINLAHFKESGAIEYSSDVLIGLDFANMEKTTTDEKGKIKRIPCDIDAEMEKDPREIELRILKNRNGPRSRPVQFQYYPKFNLFLEKGWQEGKTHSEITEELEPIAGLRGEHGQDG